MALEVLDLHALRRWVVIARADLAAHAEAINRLNVFPVPDADTGTNMLLTVDEALHEMTDRAPAGLPEAAATLARATLTSARGNSGVILSQLVRGVAEVVATLKREHLTGPDLAHALRRASDHAWAGVSRPVDGTVLTVAAAAADGAGLAVARGDDSLHAVTDAALTSARAALLATEEQLPALRAAQVVDAGGAGYLLVLEALLRVVEGAPGLATPADRAPEWLTRTPVLDVTAVHDDAACDAHAGGPSYEVMYLLDGTDQGAVTELKRTLDGLGDSLVVAGGPDLWTVHVHVDDVSAALNAGELAGRPHRFSITRFAEQLGHAADESDSASQLALLAVVDGEPLALLARSLGGQAVHDVTASHHDTAQQGLPDLLRNLRARDVLVLCDSEAARDLVAEAIGETHYAGEAVVLGRNPVEVVAVLSVVDVTAGLATARTQAESVLESLTALTYATAADAAGAADAVSARLAEGGELVTIVTGRDAADDLALSLQDRLRRDHPGVDIAVTKSGSTSAVLAVGIE